MKETTITNRTANGRVVSSPPDDLDLLREAHWEASLRYLGALMERRRFLDVEITQLEEQVGAMTEGRIAAREAEGEPVPRVKRTAKSKPNGVHDEPPKIVFPVEKMDLTRLTPIDPDEHARPYPDRIAESLAAREETIDLRRVRMESVVDHLALDIRERIVDDLRSHGLVTLDDLFEWRKSPETAIEDFLSVEKDRVYLLGALKKFFVGSGLSAAELTPDGFPRGWGFDAEVEPGPTVEEIVSRPVAKRAPKPADGTYRPAALLEALENMPVEWFKASGATDAELVEAIKIAFDGLAVPGLDWSVSTKGRMGPRFWGTKKGSTSAKAATLWGQSLIFAVRSLFEIGPAIGLSASGSGGGDPVAIEVERKVAR